MDVEKYRKLTESDFITEQRMKAVGNKIQDYNDEKQNLYIERSEIFKPITEGVVDVKKSIDERQDKLIEQLQDNFDTVTNYLEYLHLMVIASR